jgi:hypothetical protein
VTWEKYEWLAFHHVTKVCIHKSKFVSKIFYPLVSSFDPQTDGHNWSQPLKFKWSSFHFLFFKKRITVSMTGFSVSEMKRQKQEA